MSRANSIAMALIMLLASFNMQVAHAAGNSAGKLYDGETIFRGLFFGIGPVAELFPEFWQMPEVQKIFANLTPVERAQYEEGVEQIIEVIRKTDAEFFAEFGEVLQSGNRPKIQATMDRAAELIQLSVEEIWGPPEDFQGADGDKYIYVWLVTFLPFVAHLAVVKEAVIYQAWGLVVLQAAVIGFNWFWPRPDDGGEECNIARDRAVDLVAERLYQPGS